MGGRRGVSWTLTSRRRRRARRPAIMGLGHASGGNPLGRVGSHLDALVLEPQRPRLPRRRWSLLPRLQPLSTRMTLWQ